MVAPHCTIFTAPPPAACTARASRTASAPAVAPLIASNRPPACTSGRVQLANRPSGATARAVTTSLPPSWSRTCGSSARPRCTETAKPSSATTSRSQSTRRAIGSSRNSTRSGRASASGMPGRPAPDPTSKTRQPVGRSSPTTAELSMWRCHSRSASPGPMSPRWTPGPASNSTYRSASGYRSPNITSATARTSASA